MVWLDPGFFYTGGMDGTLCMWRKGSTDGPVQSVDICRSMFHADSVLCLALWRTGYGLDLLAACIELDDKQVRKLPPSNMHVLVSLEIEPCRGRVFFRRPDMLELITPARNPNEKVVQYPDNCRTCCHVCFGKAGGVPHRRGTNVI